MSASAVSIQKDGWIARLTLRRPTIHNALGLEDVERLRAALAALAADGGLRAVIVEGGGTGVFCAGLEYSEIHRIDGRNNPFTAACDELERLPAPTVCAVRRGAYGAGADLALACDFRVGTPDCAVRIPATALGVHYDQSGIERAARRVGPQAARRLFLGAERLGAEDLLRIGFLDEVAEDARFEARIEERVRCLAALAPVAARDLKLTLAAVSAGRADPAEIADRVARSWSSEDFREGARARDERRAPVFRGR